MKFVRQNMTLWTIKAVFLEGIKFTRWWYQKGIQNFSILITLNGISDLPLRRCSLAAAHTCRRSVVRRPIWGVGGSFGASWRMWRSWQHSSLSVRRVLSSVRTGSTYICSRKNRNVPLQFIQASSSVWNVNNRNRKQQERTFQLTC